MSDFSDDEFQDLFKFDNSSDEEGQNNKDNDIVNFAPHKDQDNLHQNEPNSQDLLQAIQNNNDNHPPWLFELVKFENNLLILKPFNKWPAQNPNHYPKSTNGALRAPKRKVDLNDEQQDFKNKFYSFFTKHKKFKKTFVQQIHEIFLMKKFNFEKMSREEKRHIDLYFVKYSEHKQKILDFLQQNQVEIKKTVFSETD